MGERTFRSRKITALDIPSAIFVVEGHDSVMEEAALFTPMIMANYTGNNNPVID